MNRPLLPLVIIGLATLALDASADTLRLRRNTDINGDVTFADGVFVIVSSFSGRRERAEIAREQVQEVRFNEVRDNPGSAPGWIFELKTQTINRFEGEDTLRASDGEHRARLSQITDKEVVTSDGKFAKSTVRGIVLSER